MISLNQAIDLWLGEAHDPPRRALFLGAGFSKACAPWAPLFGDYAEPMLRTLASAGDVWAAAILRDHAAPDITDLIERVDRHLGRAAVARVLLSEPIPSQRDTNLVLFPSAPPWERTWPAGMPRTFATLAEWRALIRDHLPTHLEPLWPDAPNLLVARLLTEGAVEEILSTNWDALIELGAMLSGLCVEDGDESRPTNGAWWRALPNRLRVFDTQDQLVTRWLREGTPTLYKLHGGVRTMRSILANEDTGLRDEQLRRAFLVSTTDLLRWQGAARWASERVPATLRSCSTLFLGVSGWDPVVYHATREQIQDWEEAATRRAAREEDPGALRLVAVDRSSGLRLMNMMTTRQPDGRLTTPVAQGQGAVAVQGLYAHWMLRAMERAGAAPSRVQTIREELCIELDRGAGDPHPTLPVCRLLGLSVGLGARFTAAATRSGPFCADAADAAPLRRWWYAPWRDAPARDATLRTVATLIGLLVQRPDLLKVDRWTGVVWIDPGHPAIAQLGLPPARATQLLLLPAPWGQPPIDALEDELRTRFGWGHGQSCESLARAPLSIVAIGFRPPEGAQQTEVHGVPARWLTWSESCA